MRQRISGRRERFLALALLAHLAVACEGPSEPPAAGRNLILVSLDTLRADHLGCYGYPRPTSPELDRFAAEGTVFERASATAPWTVPSHMSMLTGLYPARHGINGWEEALPEDIETLARLLQEQGYRTAGMVNVRLLSRDRHFHRGFDSYQILSLSHQEHGARPMIDRAIEFLEQDHAAPFFLFLHIYDPHSDYNAEASHRELFERPYSGEVDGTTAQLRAFRQADPIPDWGAAEARRLVDLYDAEIHQLDAELHRFFECLRSGPFPDNTVVAVTSDHGEEFLEHGSVLHGRTLHEELLHIPLILWGAGVPHNRRVDTPASLVDLVPTLLSLAELPCPVGLDGMDLTPAWSEPDGWESDRWVFAEADKWNNQKEGNFRRSVRRGDFKLLYDHHSQTREVYRLSKDPEERQNLADKEPELTRALSQALDQFMERARVVEDTLEMSEEELERLRELGYL